MSDEEDPRLARALGAYRVPEVSDGFADEVAARVRRPRGSRWPFLGAAGVLAAALLALLLWPRVTPRRTAGSARPAVRASIELGGRGIAVAEAGADLWWTVQPGGDARVLQLAGDVFYRVEPGGEFVVVTPYGEVTVRGTCFRVEVQPMKISRQNLISGGIGALIAATTLVTVYEGRVRFGNHGGAVTVAAGERARMQPAGVPSIESAPSPSPSSPASTELPPPDPTASREQLLAENSVARRELGTAQKRIAGLEEQLAEARHESEETPLIDPPQELLQTWAAGCEVHLDAPDVLGAAARKLAPKDVSDWGLVEGEQAVVEKALADLHVAARAEMREIYLAATGNTAGADELTPSAMLSEIFGKAVPSDEVRARQRLARERAGLQPPPADPTASPAVERALRLVGRLGNDMESQLGKALTPARAHELRERHNAWPGIRVDSGGCEGLEP